MSCILIISPEPWEGLFVSKHHYAMELAKRGHEVLFLGPPEDIVGIFLETVRMDGVLITVVHAARVAPGLRFLPSFFRRWLEARWLKHLEQLVGKKIDVIWNFENSRFFDMTFAGNRLKIYHQVDLNQNFNVDTAAGSASLSVAVSGPIEQRLKRCAGTLIRITHGCPPSAVEGLAPVGVDEAFSTHSVNAVMIGNLELKYLDAELLERLVTGHPEVKFHFVGNYSEGEGLHGTLGRVSNTIFWGRYPSTTLPSFLVRADILLVAYRAGEQLEQLANPHKIMEYLAAGKCVLATRTLDYEELPGLIEMGQDRAEYFARFSEIAADPSAWNTPDSISRRQAFAADNTYARQLDRIAEALGPKGHLIS